MADDPTPAPVRREGAWPQLAIVVVLAGVLAGLVVAVDVDRIADEGWQDNALWALGAATVLVGLALAALATSVDSPTSTGALTRVAMLVAILGVVVAVIMVGLADVNGGEVPSPTAASTGAEGEDVDGTGQEAVAPLTPEQARQPENVVAAALPITERTAVYIELTDQGRRLLAAAMGCRPNDFRDRTIVGSAIGGTWAEPLLLPSPPVDAQGNAVVRCRRSVVRLPLTAGTIRPGI